MTDKTFSERFRDLAQSLHDQNTSAMKLFLKDASRIMEEFRQVEEGIAADRMAWDQEKSGWGREKNLLQSAARAAEQREGKVQDQIELERRRHADEMQQASDEISRLRGLVDVADNAFQAAKEGTNADRRLSRGLPAFSPLPELPQAGGHKGYVYQSVLSDAVGSMKTITAMDDALGKLAGKYPPIDTKKLEAEIPVVSVTPEARALASAGT